MVNNNNVMDYAKTLDWSPQDSNDLFALCGIIKNHMLDLDSRYVPA